ncbi:SCP-2 sterol transfer family protein [Sulfitobacter guttiformis]|uniref:SCP-2 sterol transfer family protein n=2 Tax=Sulfitobacter guttiformis TaxID=74349 RepID=A0A420DNT6_9RHOB|nr:SCP-2 sterol transfer family protein [Sulfitobacter guttiformis]
MYLTITTVNVTGGGAISSDDRHHLPKKGQIMSDMINEAVKVLSAKMDGVEIGGTVKFEIEGEGSVMVDDSGVRAGDEEADVTLTADPETFQGIMSGDTNPTSAFMTGKLKVDGDMGMAMKLASALA